MERKYRKRIIIIFRGGGKKEVTKNKLHEKLIYVYYQVKEMNNISIKNMKFPKRKII